MDAKPSPLHRLNADGKAAQTVTQRLLSAHTGCTLLAATPEEALQAGEQLAKLSGVALYHIDLAQVVSKYIGETEKNLDRILSACESGAVVLFEAGDDLFGEGREASEHFVELGSLLQRYLERYQLRGLVCLSREYRINPKIVQLLGTVIRL